MDSDSTEIVKVARNCHTKLAWKDFNSEYGERIAKTTCKRLAADIFKILKSDSDSLKYDSKVFLNLLKGAHHSNNLELALEIGSFCSKIRNIDFYLDMISVHLDNSDPKSARLEAKKALRLTKLSAKEELKLRMHVVSSYAEEGKFSRATSMFDNIEKLISSKELSEIEKYDFITQVGRLHFFLGNYDAAIPFYKQASDFYLETRNWEVAARCLFNTGACLSNSDNSNQEEAFYYIETCRQICEQNGLATPLAHIESFYGLNAYQRGNFSEAKEYFYTALQHTQEDEARFTRLHFLSMLALTCFASGRFSLGKKYAEQTLRLSKTDESVRYRTRYINLEAEMLWQEGEIHQSQNVLKPAIEKLLTKGLDTLEELATYNMLLAQEAQLGENKISKTKIKIADILRRNSFNWLENKYQRSEILLNNRQYSEAEKNYHDILSKAEAKNNKYHQALGLFGLIKVQLAQNKIDESFYRLLTKFSVSVARIANTPLKLDVYIIKAATSYRTGKISTCIKQLKAAQKISAATHINKILLRVWINTLEGKATKINSIEELAIISRNTRIFFAPNIERVGASQYRVSHHYLVDLNKQPKVNELVTFILNHQNDSFTSAQLQKEVWQQSIKLKGWQQKIRNTVQRLRQAFAPSIAPLLLVQDVIRFFSEGIEIISSDSKPQSRGDIIKDLIKKNSLSSLEIAAHLNTSVATTKRVLKQLVDSEQIFVIKDGRSVTYKSIEGP